MWVIEPDSICNECRHCQFEGDGISEPVLCWREEEMDNFGTTEGCYRYEEYRYEKFEERR
jgi:hypothetical protein